MEDVPFRGEPGRISRGGVRPKQHTSCNGRDHCTMSRRMVAMRSRPRIYDAILTDHLARRRQMAFVTGPRQVGKTTTCRALSTAYLSWDDADHRRVILAGPAAVAGRVGLGHLQDRRPTVVLDELHKFRRWKAFLKGFFDTYADELRLIVTGSARLDVFRRGGDSLMGRYLPYRMHPFSVAEVADPSLPDETRIVRRPRRIPDAELDALLEHGGFPEPFLARDARFTRRWGALRREQLIRGDLRDLTRIADLAQLDTFAHVLEERSATQVVYANLARELSISVDTARRWIDVLGAFHLGFVVRPWFRNVPRSLRKEPKWYLRDWSHDRRPRRAGRDARRLPPAQGRRGLDRPRPRRVPARLSTRQGEARGRLRGRARPEAVVPRGGQARRRGPVARVGALPGAGGGAVRVPGGPRRTVRGRGLLRTPPRPDGRARADVPLAAPLIPSRRRARRGHVHVALGHGDVARADEHAPAAGAARDLPQGVAGHAEARRGPEGAPCGARAARCGRPRRARASPRGAARPPDSRGRVRGGRPRRAPPRPARASPRRRVRRRVPRPRARARRAPTASARARSASARRRRRDAIHATRPTTTATAPAGRVTARTRSRIAASR